MSEKAKYRHVGIEDRHMRMAYDIAKSFYRPKRWNLKTTPVCVIVKDQTVIGIGIAGGGMHPMRAECARLYRPGSPYSECEWCQEEAHAEQEALRALKADPRGATAYLYGMYHMCETCRAAMAAVGIEDLVLLGGAEVLFNRHDPGTVIGTPRQFEL